MDACPCRHYQPPICAALLNVKPGEHAELRIKAYAGRVMLSFLQFTTAELVNTRHEEGLEIRHDLLLMHGVLTSLCDWFSKVETAGRYLTQQEADDIWETSLLCPALSSSCHGLHMGRASTVRTNMLETCDLASSPCF